MIRGKTRTCVEAGTQGVHAPIRNVTTTRPTVCAHDQFDLPAKDAPVLKHDCVHRDPETPQHTATQISRQLRSRRHYFTVACRKFMFVLMLKNPKSTRSPTPLSTEQNTSPLPSLPSPSGMNFFNVPPTKRSTRQGTFCKRSPIPATHSRGSPDFDVC